ncbi:MAG: phosphoadenylylsulfate reductase [Cytophagaceae bacterium]|nr:phosphoadenylylsulfate reductase [Cytophagaceae bacterium]
MYNDQLTYIKANIDEFNRFLRNQSPEKIIKFILSTASTPILTSNFGPYSSSLIHAVSVQKPGIPLIWCDTGFNTPETRNFVKKLDADLPFDLKVYKPSGEKNYLFAPSPEDNAFEQFVERVKLEPFGRAMDEHQPDVWFTNIRKGQTAHRDKLDVLSLTNYGILKVSPFYHFSETEIQGYLKQHSLPNEFNYYDPTKPQANMECGLQLR